MVDFVAKSEELFEAYNTKDYDGLDRLLAPDLDFAHYNRNVDNYECHSSKDIIDIIRNFAENVYTVRRYEADRITAQGNIVVREAWYTGTPTDEVPGFAAAGEEFKLRIVTVLRFDDVGTVVEWKDHG